MSSKALPILQGQRIKTRKRDEKEKFDPGLFRDSLLSGLSSILNPDSGPSTPIADSGEPVDSAAQEKNNGNGSSHAPTAITKDHLDALYKYLDTQGGSGKIDYRKYGESLFDILIAGGLLGTWSFCLLPSLI